MAIAPSSRYKRVTAALDERARERLWSGSSSDSSPGSSPELADLLDSFYGDEERDVGSDVGGGEGEAKAVGMEREVLMGLAVGRRDEEEKRVVDAVEAAVGRVMVSGDEGGEEEKRKVVWWLRRSGFDAGLCKSKPDEINKTTSSSSSKTRFPSQSRHVYIDLIVAGGTRYIVEVNLASEFKIARPTPEYASLLAALPCVFVGRSERLRDVVRLLCAAAATSMRSMDMHVPPWRRREYVQAKWLGAYRRSTGVVGMEEGGREEVASCRRDVVGCREELGCGEKLRSTVVGGRTG